MPVSQFYSYLIREVDQIIDSFIETNADAVSGFTHANFIRSVLYFLHQRSPYVGLEDVSREAGSLIRGEYGGYFIDPNKNYRKRIEDVCDAIDALEIHGQTHRTQRKLYIGALDEVKDLYRSLKDAKSRWPVFNDFGKSSDVTNNDLYERHHLDVSECLEDLDVFIEFIRCVADSTEIKELQKRAREKFYMGKVNVIFERAILSELSAASLDYSALEVNFLEDTPIIAFKSDIYFLTQAFNHVQEARELYRSAIERCAMKQESKAIITYFKRITGSENYLRWESAGPTAILQL